MFKRWLLYLSIPLLVSAGLVFAQSIPTPGSGAVSITGTVDVTSSTLMLDSTGASIGSDTSSIDAKTPALGAALIAASTPVNIASDQTVPISAASLPLPTGAATQATLATIDTDTSALAGTVSGVLINGVGNSFFAIDRNNIGASSANLAFGFTSKKILVRADSDNADDICIDWAGGTAVCPAANTAGDDRLAAGESIILDDIAVSSISIIAASGTLTVNVTAWN